MRFLLEILIYYLFQRIVAENRRIKTQQNQKSQIIQTVLQNSTYSQIEIHYEQQDDNILIIDTLTFCSCSEFLLQVECENFGCKWEDESCFHKLCSDFIDQWECSERLNCIWDQFSCIYADPSNCANYKYSSICEYQDNCVYLNNQCQKGKVNCQHYSEYECYLHYNCTFLNNQCISEKDVVCEQIINDYDCRYFVNDFKICYWIEDKCQTLEINNCFDIKIEYLCFYFSCHWYNNSCQEKSCEDQEYGCYSLRTFRNKEKILKLCKSNQNNQCQPVYDANVFGADECLWETYGTHHWDGQNCQQCSNIQLLQYYWTLFILLI